MASELSSFELARLNALEQEKQHQIERGRRLREHGTYAVPLTRPLAGPLAVKTALEASSPSHHDRLRDLFVQKWRIEDEILAITGAIHADYSRP